MSTQNDWEDEIKDMLSDAGLKPIHFMLNNSGVRILNRIREELADVRREAGLKHYMRVAEHLRQYGRDRLMKDDERARGFYGAIEELERYFGIATLREEEVTNV